MTIEDRKKAMIRGSLVADAASMGMHWMYTPARIKELAPDTPEFRAPDAADYDGVAGYFAHANRRPNDFSQYGEQAMVMLRSLEIGYSRATYQRMFREHFGYGGTYTGYIDRPTRDTLDKISENEAKALSACRAVDPSIEDGVHSAIVSRVTAARTSLDGPDLTAKIESTVRAYNNDDALVAYALKVSDVLAEHDGLPGADDVQLPAVSKLAALVACHHNAPNLDAMVDEAVRITNNSDVAVAWAQFVAQMLKEVLETGKKPDIATLATAAPDGIGTIITSVLSRLEETTEAVTADIGLPCYLRMGVPSVVHNILRTTSFEDGVRANIYAGGDNCGRAVILGAALGALYGVPEAWSARLAQKEAVETALANALST